MFCKNCGKEVDQNAVACMGCGCNPKVGNKFCANCGAQVNPEQVVCIKCGASLKGSGSKAASASTPGEKSRVTAGVLAILLGCVGAHEFYLGNTVSAIIRLAVSIVGFVFGGAAIMGLIGLIEGIIYLTKTDDDFKVIYVDGKKSWF